jgi:uncharacterized protein (TIGR02145 family)
MKAETKTLNYLLVFIGIMLFLSTNCKKDNDENKIPIETGTVTDIEGNVYKTVKIGTQWWMAENLKVTRYRNDKPIVYLDDSAHKGAYCWYNNDIAYKATSGALYNWYAVANSQNLAPAGWHVPTENDWRTLKDYLGDNPWSDPSSGKMKSTSGWVDYMGSSGNGTNSSGFNALPAGYGLTGGNYVGLAEYTIFWASSGCGELSPYSLELSYIPNTLINCYHNPGEYLSVRCLKD